jgi:hypothetical protein
MTGKEIDSSATALLVLILPIAVLIVVLFQAWPVLLALFVISMSYRIWQQYQWRQWSKQVNPYFNQLLKENQGCLTPVDLSMKANLSGTAARWYLDKKAEEFGAQRRDYEGKGTVYYFLTASALGSIFEDSEPIELDTEDITSPVLTLLEPPPHIEPPPSESKHLTGDDREPLQPSVEEESVSPVEVFPTDKVEAEPEPPEQQEPEHKEAPQEQAKLEPPEQQKPEYEEVPKQQAEAEPPQQQKPEHEEVPKQQAELKPPEQQKPEYEEAPKEQKDLSVESPDKEQEAPKPLIQAELAKRLDVHSSTVGKRKADPDFPEWSQSRDPEGIAWKYSPDTKEFVAIEKLESE